ncbi:hypothetical protein CYMTET_28547 [Cymbomonas tetramitiformis]|uniref:Uncharacterized protein n=1 Tax=Cymbomonas tetramitiformis TaxID=36881 RepID=A0AAE0KVT0_9CHLO|nr:hypothetical protein CYMTET_28547 [Cymbomonas tetramitiformis]
MAPACLLGCYQAPRGVLHANARKPSQVDGIGRNRTGVCCRKHLRNLRGKLFRTTWRTHRIPVTCSSNGTDPPPESSERRDALAEERNDFIPSPSPRGMSSEELERDTLLPVLVLLAFLGYAAIFASGLDWDFILGISTEFDPDFDLPQDWTTS